VRKLLAIVMALPLFQTAAADLHVFAAASLTDALKEIAADFEEQSGTRVSLNFGGSSLLARQIEEGAPADVFLSADEAKMDQLQKDGLIDPASRADLLGNSLVIVTAAASGLTISKPADLLRPEFRKIALADPQVVPAGIYARKFLEHIQLAAPLGDRIVPTDNVRAALAAVEAGNADAAFVYETDVAISHRVRVGYAVREKDTPPISYPVAILRETTARAAAEQFVRYLRSPAASAVFTRYGFVVKR
jgi:molybdate transport system substrate-binding protein